MSQPPAHCDLCNDKRHHWTKQGWARCRCIYPIIILGFIKEDLKGADTAYPERFKAEPPIPMQDFVSLGGTSWDDFRFRAWRSLEDLAESKFSYDCISPMELKEINFDKGTKYTSLSELVALDLLIMGFPEDFNVIKTFGLILGQVLSARRRKGKPTWIHSPLAPAQFRQIYTPEALEAVQGGGAFTAKPETQPRVERAVTETLNRLMPPTPKKSNQNRDKGRA